MRLTEQEREDRDQRIRELRAAGVSWTDIRVQLGVGTKTIARAMGPLAPPRGPRPRIPDEVKERARQRRREGASVPEIAEELGIARSTAWTLAKDIPLSRTAHRPRSSADRGREYWCHENRRREAIRQQQRLDAARSVGRVSDRELLLAGAVAYWAEGSKAKPWRRSQRLVFTNSDPVLIRLYLRWLDLLGVEPDRRVYSVSIHETGDIDGALQFWADVVDVPTARFGRPVLKRHRPSTNRRNQGVGYHGCLVVRVLGSADLYLQAEGLVHGLVAGLASVSPVNSRPVRTGA
jgi:transposase-like protein